MLLCLVLCRLPLGEGDHLAVGLLAEVVLDLAGVVGRHLGVYPQGDEERRQFAVAVIDPPGDGDVYKRQALYGARDMFGIKPFYYTRTDAGELVFGSEIKSLLEHPGFRREVNPEALRPYLTFQYLSLIHIFS